MSCRSCFHSSVILFVGMTMAATAGTRPAPSGPRSTNESGEVRPGIVFVKFKQGQTITSEGLAKQLGNAPALLRSAGAMSAVRTFPLVKPLTKTVEASGKVDLSRIYTVTINDRLDPRDVVRKLRTSDLVEYAEPSYIAYLNDVPNDPSFSSQTDAFTRLNALNGWTLGKGSHAVVIAAVDGGTYWQHEDLSPNLWINRGEDINDNGRFDPGPAGDENGIDDDHNGFVDDVIGWNFANKTNNPRGLAGTPESGAHGTATASHFGAFTNNGLGMAGSSWNCALMPVCVSSATSDGSIAFGYEGIQYASAMGAHVINCSWGRTGLPSAFEQEVITAATQAGSLIVCSAGNGTNNNGGGKSNDLSPDFPSGYKNVLPVGATFSTSDGVPSFSNYGLTVPVYAPGVNIWSALNGGGYGNGGSGTSYSSPLTGGLAGILKSVHPTWTPRQLATQIRVTADSIDGVNPGLTGNLGRGRVNFARALTESHPGIEILSATLKTTQGKTLFVTGDTVVLSMTVQNILFATATNLEFTATTSDPSLQVIQSTASPGTLSPGEQATLTDLVFRVGTQPATRTLLIKVAWRSNVNDQDVYGFRITVYPVTPLWLAQASPTSLSLFSVKTVDANVAWAAGGNGGATEPVVLRTTDGGLSWNDVTGNLTALDAYCVTAIDATHAWIGTGSGAIYATLNGGASWFAEPYPGTQSPFIDGVWFFDANNGYAMGDPAGQASGDKFIVLKTTNGGQTWSHLANEPVIVAGEAGWNNSFWWTDINHGWFGTNQSRVWRTVDGGSTWSSAGSGAANSYGVAFRDANYGIAVHDGGVAGRTTDGGVSWTTTLLPQSVSLTAVSYPPGSPSAWVTTGLEMYRTPNDGASWVNQALYPIAGGLQHVSVIDTSTGWAVTSFGEILQYNLNPVTGVEPPGPAVAPQIFALNQNYPNPFNPATVVSYLLPAGSHVQLAVYDLLGREVKILVDQQQQAGPHRVEFDGSGLASGMYFYRLTAQSSGPSAHALYSQTKKMVLVK